MRLKDVLDSLPGNFYPLPKAPSLSPNTRTGRPSVMTELALLKLRTAFLIGCSEREACVFAGIHRMTLYRYQDKNPDFCDQKEAWRTWLVIQARKVISDAIHAGDSRTAWQFLRVYRANEF